MSKKKQPSFTEQMRKFEGPRTKHKLADGRTVTVSEYKLPLPSPSRTPAPKAAKALRLLGEAARLLRESSETAADREQWPVSGELERYAMLVEEVISSDGGNVGLQPFLAFLGRKS